MKLKDLILRCARSIYRNVTNTEFHPPICECDRQKSNDIIFNRLSTEKATLIARFGTVEINCINNYLCIVNKESYVRKLLAFITDNTHTPWWNERLFNQMETCAGVIGANPQVAEQFSVLYLKDIPEIDILASHQYYEKFMPLCSDIESIQLETLYPFFVERPWTRVLKDKKVLVVHPFDQSIRRQFKIKEFLFDNKSILPDFDLITYKAVQTAAHNRTIFSNWFDALNHMKREIEVIDFDIAILGCGAYGLPLGAHIKRMGKQAVHMGGGTQLLFGILGNRWLYNYPKEWHYRPGITINTDYTPLFNSHWTHPGHNERPAKASTIENGCYW